jgi:hypothetical protein
MKSTLFPSLSTFAALLLVACGGPAEIGEECFDDGDCAEGLECHIHHDHEEGEEQEEGEEEAGFCDEPGDHDHEDA